MDETIRARVDALKESIGAIKGIVAVVEAVGITVEDKPTEMPSRPGYQWVPHQAQAGGPITWIESESEDKRGTADQPIFFTAGMEVWPNWYYTDGTTRFVCIQHGTPDEIAEGDYFTAF